MDSDDNLENPPGYIFSEDSVPSFYNPSTEQPLLFIDSRSKYGYNEAKLRILYCCRDLGISESHEIKYPDIQKIYEKRFGTQLNRDEMKELFGMAYATNILKQEFFKYFVVIEASENEDQCIKIRMKEKGIDEVIEEISIRCSEMEPLELMDPLVVEEILRSSAARDKAYEYKVRFTGQSSRNNGNVMNRNPRYNSTEGSSSFSEIDCEEARVWKREYEKKLTERNDRWKMLKIWKEAKLKECISNKSKWPIHEYQKRMSEIDRRYQEKSQEFREHDSQVDDLYRQNMQRLREQQQQQQ